MSDANVLLERIPTGIPGLDPILEGGLLKGGVYVVQGPPGAGKTIFGNQLCFSHAADRGQAVYITLLAESHARMLAHLRRMAFFKAHLIPDAVYYISGFKVLQAEGLDGLLRVLRQAITMRKATLLVLDGFVSAEEASPSPTDLKKFIHELQAVTAMTLCTVVLLSSTERLKTVHAEHTMVDGILELSDEVNRLRPIRHFQVRKMRGADQVRGKHTVEITDEGMRVRPRIETQLQGPGEDRAFTPGNTKLGFGIPRFDEMLHGGLPVNSMTMILGPSGSGKTTLGLQFLAEGARNREPALYFGFYERPAAIIEKGTRIGVDLKRFEAEGSLELLWQRPVEGVIDILGERLISAVRRRNVKRLFIDGIQGFELAIDDYPDRIRGVFAALAEELERQQVTTIYSVETRELFGPVIQPPISGISASTQNLILLRHVEFRAQLYRLISILKIRDSSYDSSIRELRVTESGITVLDRFENAEQIMSGSALPNGLDKGRV